MQLAATYRRVDTKQLARYQIILFGEQTHIGVNNLPKVVARQCNGLESNPRPLDHESDTLTTTPRSHNTPDARLNKFKKLLYKKLAQDSSDTFWCKFMQCLVQTWAE